MVFLLLCISSLYMYGCVSMCLISHTCIASCCFPVLLAPLYLFVMSVCYHIHVFEITSFDSWRITSVLFCINVFDITYMYHAEVMCIFCSFVSLHYVCLV